MQAYWFLAFLLLIKYLNYKWFILPSDFKCNSVWVRARNDFLFFHACTYCSSSISSFPDRPCTMASHATTEAQSLSLVGQFLGPQPIRQGRLWMRRSSNAKKGLFYLPPTNGTISPHVFTLQVQHDPCGASDFTTFPSIFPWLLLKLHLFTAVDYLQI